MLHYFSNIMSFIELRRST